MGLPPVARWRPSVLGRRQALGLALALAVLGAGRLVRQELLVGPDGAWRRELWLDAALESAVAAGGDGADGPFSGGAMGTAAAGMASGSDSLVISAAPAAPAHPPAGERPRRTAGAGKAAGLKAPLAINACSADSLQLLPGVGPVMAERIAAARRQGVIFRKPEDLLAIKGIGPATVARLTPFLSFGTRADTSSAPGAAAASRPDNPH